MMVVRLPDVWYESVMLGGCCGADGGSSGAGPVLRLATSCPKCSHTFGVRAHAPAAVCCAASRALHALTGGGLVKLLPEAPPSAPAATVPTWTWFTAPPSPPSPDCLTEVELSMIANTLRVLDASGWYYRNLGWQESQRILAETAPGTFLVRDSADPNCLLALSVQTECGPTSVRLQHRSCKFRLDSEPYLAPYMPAFECAVALVEYYVVQAEGATPRKHVWVDGSGEARAAAALRRPLRKAPPTLMHLSRLAIHGALRASPAPRLPALPPPHERLPLPRSLVRYLSEYPYSC